jgi:L-threonylcarbamoyladenylate synthase
MSRVLAVDPTHPQTDVIAEAVRVLRDGGLVAFPTETVYGLGASALDEAAVRRLFAAKGRPFGHPLIAHVASDRHARSLARTWPEMASRLSRAFWPGPLTLVVDRALHVPDVVSGGKDSIALRAPAHRVALAIIEGLGAPVAAPSANLHQELSPTLASHVVRQMGDLVDLVLDGGPCSAGIESTVVDVRGAEPRVLRPGALSLADLRALAPEVQAVREAAPDGEARASPGMGARHYAPRARLRLAGSLAEAQAVASEAAVQGKVGVVLFEEFAGFRWPEAAIVRVPGRAPAEYARMLYATLHELDEEGVCTIVVVRVPEGEAWWAIADRLERGAAD